MRAKILFHLALLGALLILGLATALLWAGGGAWADLLWRAWLLFQRPGDLNDRGLSPRSADQLRPGYLLRALRAAGIRAEIYLGESGMKAQMKYADKRGAPCVVIQGDDERARGEVQVKDLVQGAQMAEGIDSREEWREARPAQVSVPVAEMVSAVKDVLARYRK